MCMILWFCQVVASLGREIALNPPLTLGQLPDTSEELMKLDQVNILRPSQLSNSDNISIIIGIGQVLQRISKLYT